MPILSELDERFYPLRFRHRKEDTDAHADVGMASHSVVADQGLQAPGIPPVLNNNEGSQAS